MRRCCPGRRATRRREVRRGRSGYRCRFAMRHFSGDVRLVVDVSDPQHHRANGVKQDRGGRLSEGVAPSRDSCTPVGEPFEALVESIGPRALEGVRRSVRRRARSRSIR